MGLDITVGAWTEFGEDPEYLDYLRGEIEKINRHLREVDLPEHHESSEPGSGETEAYQMWGYSGLHRLRRLAALLRLDRAPEPLDADDDATESPELEDYYSLSEAACQEVARSGLRSLFGVKRTKLFSSPPAKGPSFDHLVHHSDADGFYVPVEFEPVVIAGAPGEAWFLGSSYALKRECETIAQAIGLPLDMDPESEEVWDAADTCDTNAEGWKRFGIESFGCLRLHSCAKLSIEQKTLLLFH